MNSETINAADNQQVTGRIPNKEGLPAYALILAWFFLVSVTWVPVFAIHVSRASLSTQDSGAVVVVFSPGMKREELFRNVINASGSIVRPVSWFPGMWVTLSREPGFAGRLMQAGAWGVYSPDLLDASELLNCMRIVQPLETESTPPAS